MDISIIPTAANILFGWQSILEDPPVFLSEKMIPSNQFGAGFICLSPNSRWLASAAKDGVLFIYDTSTMVGGHVGTGLVWFSPERHVRATSFHSKLLFTYIRCFRKKNCWTWIDIAIVFIMYVNMITHTPYFLLQ